MEQSIPYPLCNLYFDYQIFEPPPESQDKCKVLIVACRKEHVDFRLDIIQQANLIPIVVEMSSYALERAYCFFYPHKINEKTILLEIGASQLALLFFNNSQTMVYCENLFNLLEPESILLQIKRCIKKYILAYPSRILRELFLLVVDISLLNYLSNELDGFSELKIKTLRYENQLKSISGLNRNKLEQKFLDLFLSYGLALRKGK